MAGTGAAGSACGSSWLLWCAAVPAVLLRFLCLNVLSSKCSTHGSATWCFFCTCSRALLELPHHTLPHSEQENRITLDRTLRRST